MDNKENTSCGKLRALLEKAFAEDFKVTPDGVAIENTYEKYFMKPVYIPLESGDLGMILYQKTMKFKGPMLEIFSRGEYLPATTPYALQLNGKALLRAYTFTTAKGSPYFVQRQRGYLLSNGDGEFDVTPFVKGLVVNKKLDPEDIKEFKEIFGVGCLFPRKERSKE